MTKNKLVLVAIVLVFTIALVCMSFLDTKKVVGNNDQVVVEYEETMKEEVVETYDMILLEGKIIVEEVDRNPDGVTALSTKPIINSSKEKGQFYI